MGDLDGPLRGGSRLPASVREALPDVREALPDVREALPDVREALPDAGKWL